MYLQNSIILLIFILSGGAFSQTKNQQATVTGFVIKFRDGITYDRQQKILGSAGLSLLPERENSLFRLISYAPFPDKKITEENIASMKKILENYEEVLFVNTMKSAGGHFSAPLGEFYVKLFSENDLGRLKGLADETGTRVLQEYHYMPGVYILSANKHSKGNAREMADYFSASGMFEYTAANMMFSLEDCNPNDPLYNKQWAVENIGGSGQYFGTPDADMDVDSAWTISTGSPLIKVAVLDSGVDTTHIDLAGNLLPGFDATDTSANNSKGYPNLNYPEDAHGTNCAGIIAALANNNLGIAGIAYSCKVIPVKMFFYISFNGSAVPWSTSQWGLDAINWASQVAQADVMSNSWGIADSLMAMLNIDTNISNAAIYDAVYNGRNGKGIPMLFSAGNSPDTFCLWPAITPATIAVGATTMCDELKTANDCSPETWSGNHGRGLDISAPGVKIATTDIMGNKGYSSGHYNLSFAGTSAACPNAAGVMALILSADNSLTSLQAREKISSSCEKVGGYNYSVSSTYGSWSMELGYGRVNAFDALEAVVGENNLIPEPGFTYFIAKNISSIYTLNYHLAEESSVSIDLYDLTGRHIRSITDRNRVPGEYSEEIDLRQHPQGIYLLKIAVDEKVFGLKLTGKL